VIAEASPSLAAIKENLEDLFRAEYPSVARLIASITRDPGRAEELAVEVFLRWDKQGPLENSPAWLRRTAIHLALDELRRRRRLESLQAFLPWRAPQNQIETQTQVTRALAALKPREAELLLLRAEGLTYEELAQACRLNPASVGTLLARARKSFEKEYSR
jgi:RNA polymerase sigma-70 factor (ECF subfamily)